MSFCSSDLVRASSARIIAGFADCLSVAVLSPLGRGDDATAFTTPVVGTFERSPSTTTRIASPPSTINSILKRNDGRMA